MPTLSTRVSDGEFRAITEYANASGLSVSDLIKKILIHKICWLWMECKEDKYFEEMYNVAPENAINDDEKMREFVNRFRKCVGIRALEVGDL
ncbi:MAG: DUF6290 family protein [Nitrosopumilaceae archaeon]